MAKVRCSVCGKKYGATLPKCPSCNAIRKHPLDLRRWSRRLAIPVLAVAATVCVLAFVRRQPVDPVVPPMQPPPSLESLYTTPPEAISTCNWDVAMVSLLCAQGLPGAENMDTNKCMAMLEKWTADVKAVTRQNMHRFRSNPREYDDSMAAYKTGMLITVLSQDLGVKYNMELVTSGAMAEDSFRFFTDSRDLFLHGVLSERRMGSCASLPVLVVAVGRRLGYPLKLVATAAHLFCRWDDGVEYQNFEFNQNGIANHPDSHYMTFPKPITPEMIEHEGFMKSMTPRDELAAILSSRALCLLQNRRFKEAKETFMRINRLQPSSQMCVGMIVHAGDMELAAKTHPQMYK